MESLFKAQAELLDEIGAGPLVPVAALRAAGLFESTSANGEGAED
jgi:hypothetical protein